MKPAHLRGWADDVHVEMANHEKRRPVESDTDIIQGTTSLCQNLFTNFSHLLYNRQLLCTEGSGMGMELSK